MELTQQVKNYHATLRINATHHKGFKDTTQDQDSHHRNLQVRHRNAGKAKQNMPARPGRLFPAA